MSHVPFWLGFHRIVVKSTSGRIHEGIVVDDELQLIFSESSINITLI